MADFNIIAKKWQKKWEESKIFKVTESTKKKKFYVLEMYPYPSGSGLHMGHARNYCIGDSFARFKRMQGLNVLYPMGYDSFGLPAENAAIKAKSHPKIFTEKAISNFIKQQKSLGLSYDWDRKIMSHDPKYYKWDQWIFLKMLEKALAYKKKSAVNWCPECNTVLANEQVHNGKCWRHTNTNVELKELDQWFFKTTDYAEELLRDIDKLEWTEDVKLMQKNWIGKSKGTLIDFEVKDSKKKLTVFTTRPDTFYGITFLVYAPEHPDVMELVKGTKYEEIVKEFVKKVTLEDRFQRTAEDKEKDGVFIGKYAINPITKEDIPIYIANFVLHEYGTGAIIAVPAHDQRDFEFAKKYNIPIKVVINPPEYDLNSEKMSRSYMGEGIMTNSGKFDGINNREAIEEITKFLEKNKCGNFTTQYKLRDWLLSRQRFWGTPIPIIYCKKCGTVPVPEKDLPVVLPEDIKFESSENPLPKYGPFINVKCPKCGKNAKRETDTMDTFVNSSWYFLRYTDPKNEENIFDPKKVDYWMPIDTYIGGKEHACMHLIYFRFYTKFLRDLGLLKIDEPCKRLFNQGMLHGNDGAVMSKSRGNVVLPEEVSKKYGIDTARLFLMFVAGPDKDMEWLDKGVEGSFKFLNKFYGLLEKKITKNNNPKQESKINKTIKEVTENIENFKFNLAIINLMEMTNYLHNKDEVNKETLEKLVLMMCIFAPHICEEMWEKLKKDPFASLADWPSFDASKIDVTAEAEEETISQLIGDITNVLKLAKVEKPKKITLIISESWKYSFFNKLKENLSKTRKIGEIIKACMDKEHQKEISQMVPKLMKNEARIPKVIIKKEKEFNNLKENGNVIKEKFKCEVEIIDGDNSQEAKAKQAIPGKPTILIG